MLQGTEITTECPERLMGSAEKTPAWATPRAWTRGTVLVIESEKLIRKWLQWVLHSRGYEVVTAATTQEAEVALCQVGARHIDLVIVDVHLQYTSDVLAGYRLYQRWKRACSTMPFLLMSDDAHDRELTAVHQGSVQLLVKRFVIAELMDAVRSLCRQESAHLNASPLVALAASCAERFDVV